eukprot:2033614-Prymnesium_polylepis.1
MDVAISHASGVAISGQCANAACLLPRRLRLCLSPRTLLGATVAPPGRSRPSCRVELWGRAVFVVRRAAWAFAHPMQ